MIIVLYASLFCTGFFSLKLHLVLFLKSFQELSYFLTGFAFSREMVESFSNQLLFFSWLLFLHRKHVYCPF